MKFVITEEEKSRILNMHKNAIKRQYLKEQDTNFGPEFEAANIRGISADEVVDNTSGKGTGMNIAINDINGNQLYYTCVTDPRLSKKELDENPNIYTAGSLYDSDFKNVKNDTILTGNWETLAKKNCGAVYKFVNDWRTENCPKLNAQTYWNYNNQCSTYLRSKQMEKDQVAAAEADSKKAAEDAAQKAATDAEIQKRAASNAEDAAMGRNFVTTMADYRSKLDKFESMTQEELETLINEINAYWKKSLLARADSEAEKTYRRVFPKFNTEFQTKFPTITVLLSTK
jgi:hypothetical protein